MITVRRIFFISLSLLGGGIASAQSVFVPLDHQVYPLLVKGETLGLFDSYRMRVLPLTRSEVAKLLGEMRKRSEPLSTADKELLQQMVGEFTDPAIGELAKPESELHIYRFEEGDAQIFLDARGIQEFRFQRGRAGLEDETISETIGIGYLRASFSKHVFIGASARSSLVRGEKNAQSRFDPSQGLPQVAVGKNLFKDQATGYVGVHYGVLNLFAGRTYLGWGSGLQEQLGLSTQNEPMDMVRFSLDFDRVRFSYFHASLQGQGQGRYLAGHRLDFLLGRNVQAGLYETVLYAGRGVQLGYLNPFVPYHIMEHQLGDLDNNMIGLDFSAVISTGLRVFGEIFIDDLNWTRSIFNYWGNKLAYQAGFHWAAPFELKPLELRASYTRVDPWVYTHTDSLNVYVHYDASIGARIGPNADRYQLAVAIRPHRNWRGELSYESVRRGRGNVRVAHRPEEGEQKRFLEGLLEHEQRLAASVRWQVARDVFTGTEVSFTIRRNANLKPGVNAHEKFLRLYIDLNY